ncbi:unnamed protein product [Phaeothamnion confervicola]
MGIDLGDDLADLRGVRVDVEEVEAGGPSGFRIRKVASTAAAEADEASTSTATLGEAYWPPAPQSVATPAVERLRGWVERIVVGLHMCPFTHSADLAGTGLEKKGVPPGPVGYPVSLAVSASGLLRDFWVETIGLLQTHPAQLSTLLLSAPVVAPDDFKRWTSMTEALTRSLRLFRVDDVIKCITFHPNYQRSAVEPRDGPAHMHLPPTSWMPKMMPSMLKNFGGGANGGDKDFDYAVSDFQRRTPHPVINVLRGAQRTSLNGGGAPSIL